jgi:peptide/nickel transport system permease protein
MSFGRFLLRRLFKYAFILFFVTTVVFVIIRLSGDPVAIMAGIDATDAAREEIRRELGLHRPIYVQYLLFLFDMLQLDFGTSITIAEGEPAGQLVLTRLPRTLALLAVALLFAFVVGTTVGMISALKQGKPADSIGMVFTLLGQSVPSFWVGLLLIIFVAARVDFFPISGSGSIRHLILPGLTLSFFLMASVARLTRSNLIDVFEEEYIKTARSKGITEQSVYFSHALRNAFIPVISFVGVQVAYLLGGAVITEEIFAYPGMGRLLLQATVARDFPIVQAIVFYVAFGVVFLNFLIDLSYRWLDPRISYEERER